MSRGRQATGGDTILYGRTHVRARKTDATKEIIQEPHYRRLGIGQAAVMQRLLQQGQCIFPAVNKYAETPSRAKQILKGLQARGYVTSKASYSGSELKVWRLTAAGERALAGSRYATVDLLGPLPGHQS